MCWYRIDPQTGEIGDRLGDNLDQLDPEYLYFNEGWSESIGESLYEVHSLLAPHERPPIEDIFELVIDCVVPRSVAVLELDEQRLRAALEELQDCWVGAVEEYTSVLGRPPTPKERALIVRDDVRKIAIGLEQFTSRKKVEFDVWYRHDIEPSWARLRVYSDGTADIWRDGALLGFEAEQDARHFIEEDHFVPLSRFEEIMGHPPEDEPPIEVASRIDSFRYFGTW